LRPETPPPEGVPPPDGPPPDAGVPPPPETAAPGAPPSGAAAGAPPAAPAPAGRDDDVAAGQPLARAGVPLAQHRIERTRTGGLWVAVAAAALVLLFLLIFILQNSQQVRVSFFGAKGHLSLGVAMLLSAVAGALLIVLVGAARIVQLRLVARRHRDRDARTGRA
jgi:uncharacterized integral membrane protein